MFDKSYTLSASRRAGWVRTAASLRVESGRVLHEIAARISEERALTWEHGIKSAPVLEKIGEIDPLYDRQARLGRIVARIEERLGS